MRPHSLNNLGYLSIQHSVPLGLKQCSGFESVIILKSTLLIPHTEHIILETVWHFIYHVLCVFTNTLT